MVGRGKGEIIVSCQFKNECPSATGWCEGPKQDFSRCIPFLVSAVHARDDKIRELEDRPTPAFREIPIFECDRRACNKCNPVCSHTPDIRHAKNFHITHTDADGDIYFMEDER